MGDFGQITVFMTMLLSALGGAIVLGSRTEKGKSVGEGVLLSSAATGAAGLFILVYLLLTHDYRIAYVHGHADRNMGLGYLATALWGGQAGSLLFWAALQTFYTAAVVVFAKDKPKIALGFLASLQVYFFALVLFHSNPFAPLGFVATEGLGINPLLLNPYMAVHPPTLFMGFVGFSVPVAYVFAILVENRSDDEWVVMLRPFVLFAWVFLSVGNLLGMVWAYQELGWGGYWGWDPVENASFMPWLTATALLHTMTVQKSKQMFRFLNPFLMVLTFCLIVFGTFITRSGVIQSVHAFADATVGPYLLGLIIAMAVGFFVLAFVRRKALVSPENGGSPLSKENLFVVTAWLLLLSCAFIWIGTMAPLFTELLKGEKVASTPAFFNQWMVPLGLTLLALLTLCLWVGHPLRKQADSLLKTALVPIGIGGVFTMAGVARFGADNLGSVVAFFILGGAITAVFQRLWTDLRTLPSRGLKGQRRRRIGAHLVHLAVVLLFFGFSGSGYTQEAVKVMNSGDRLIIGDYTLTFAGLREETDYRRYALFGDLAVEKSGRFLGVYSTARMVFHSHPKQPTSEVAIRSGLLADLFMILGRIDETTKSATIRVVINPLVVWIWMGGVLLVIGTLVGFSGVGSSRPLPSVSLRGSLYYLLPTFVLTTALGLSSPENAALIAIGGALAIAIWLLWRAIEKGALWEA